MRIVPNSFPGPRRFLLAAALVGLTLPGLAGAGGTSGAVRNSGAAGGPKRPQALLAVAGPGGELVLSANGDGSLSVISAADLAPVGEIRVGGDLTGLAPLGDGSGRVAAVDHRGHRLVVLRVAVSAGGEVPVAVEAAFPTCRYPVRAAARGGVLAVSCLWSRKAVLYDLESVDPPEAPAGAGGLAAPAVESDLPFEPRELLFLDDRTLLLADGFAGELALVSVADGRVLRRRELAAHNLRGLALLPGGERVAVAHQQLHSGMHTTRDDILWGVFITNSVTTLTVPDLLSGDPRLARRSRVRDLGSVATPSGDPAAVLATAAGELVVALGGVSRVAFGADDGRQPSHLRVGEGPSALALGADGRVYVANTRSDTLSVIAADRRREIARIPLGREPPARTAADRGEALFHDATRSLRGWMSCASCHAGGHTNHGLSDTLGDGHYGAPKRVLSLLGVAGTRPFAWDGGMRQLEDQIAKSVRTTLRGPELTGEEIADLAAYLRTLEPPDALAAPEPPAEVLAAGRAAFEEYSCSRCHRAPLYTSPGVHDVGLTDERGATRFNPPSLRGVRFRRTLFHDGSARSLEEVLRIHPGNGVSVAAEDLRNLVAFLRTL